MHFAGMNYLAILVAGTAGFFVGMGWYMALGKQWMAALGKNKHDFKPSPGPFIAAGLCQLFMAFMLAGIIGHLGDGQVTIRNGIISGAFMWAGFVATTMIVNYAFQGQPKALSFIDGGHWLAVLLVMGAIIGAFGL